MCDKFYHCGVVGPQHYDVASGRLYHNVNCPSFDNVWFLVLVSESTISSKGGISQICNNHMLYLVNGDNIVRIFIDDGLENRGINIGHLGALEFFRQYDLHVYDAIDDIDEDTKALIVECVLEYCGGCV